MWSDIVSSTSFVVRYFLFNKFSGLTSSMCNLERLPLRLSGGLGRCSGRLEVYHNAVWGSVCADLWDISDAQVVCRQLGCGDALRADGNSVFGAGEGVVWLNRVECRGNEIHLWDCPLSLKKHTDCSHKEHAGLTCAGHSNTLNNSSHFNANNLCLFALFRMCLCLFCPICQCPLLLPQQNQLLLQFLRQCAQHQSLLHKLLQQCLSL
jgi:hypothetical protein